MKMPVVLLSLMAVIGLAGAARAATECYTNTVYFGWAGCQPIVDDYDGDGLDDIAVYDTVPAVWYVWQSTNDVLRTGQWGAADCVPMQGDYDGDGMADLAVYQPATGKWWIYSMGTATALVAGGCWGSSDCVPIPADYDGDGADDVAVYESSARKWYIYSVKNSAVLLYDAVWGAEGVTPVPADYDGDGKADPALYQESSGTWGALLSGSGYQFSSLSCGAAAAGYVPAPADYNGDGCAEPALYSAEAGKYYIWLTTNAILLEFDVPTGGVPCPARYYMQDVYTMAVFQTNVEAALGVTVNSGGRFDIIVPDASSAVSDGIMDGFAAISSVIAPFSFGLQVFDMGFSILQVIGVIPDPQEQILEMLNQMDKKLNVINDKLNVILIQIATLQRFIDLKFAEIKKDINWGPLSTKITTILAAHNELLVMTSTNYVATNTFADRQEAMSNLVYRLENTIDIQSVTEQLAINLLAEVESTGRGFLDIYTDYLINNHVKPGKNLLYCYLNLEYLFGRVLAHEYKGAQLTMELLTQTSGTNAAIQWRDSIFLSGPYCIAAQMDKFQECALRMVDAKTDTGFYVICPPADRRFLPAHAAEIYGRVNFVAAYCSTNSYHGLAGRLIGEPGRIYEYGRQGQVRANNLPLSLMRRVARAVPAMWTPYTAAAEWLVYEYISADSYQVTTTNQMAFDIFALTNAAAGDYPITVAGEHESESAQTITVQWRSNDYVTVVSPGTSNSVPYGYFVVPVRHYVSDHTGGATWENAVQRYSTDWSCFADLITFGFGKERTVNHIYHHVTAETDPHRANSFWFLWEHSLAFNLPKAAAMNNRTVGLYGKSRLEWRGNNQVSELGHTIGIGTDLENYTSKANCIHQSDVKCVTPQTFHGAATVTGKVKSSRQYLSVFSSARGRCWRPGMWDIDAYEKVWAERMILYIP